MPADHNGSALAPRADEGALSPYLRAIRAHKIAFIAIVAAALLGALLWLVIRSPTYEATAQLLVTPLPQDDQEFLGFELLRDSGDPTRTVQTAATLVESRVAAEATARQLGGDWTADKVLDAISIQPEGESNIVAVTAQADDPQLAARIANTFAATSLATRAKALRAQIDQELKRLRAGDQPTAPPGEESDVDLRIRQLEALQERGDPTLSLSQRATPPTSATGAGPLLVILLALLAGVALAAVATILLELTGGKVRDEQDAAEIFGLPVLARVPELPRRFRERKTGEPWIMPPLVREAFRTLAVQLDRRGSGRVIMLTSASTGDGKTTSAINLATELAVEGRRTLLLDLDIRKPAVGVELGFASEQSHSALLDEDVSLESLVSPSPGLPSLSVLAIDPRGPQDAALMEKLARRLPEIVAEARELAEFIVVDTAPVGEVSDALRFTRQVDEILVVTRPGHTNRSNAKVMRELMDGLDERPRGLVVIGDATGTTNRYYMYGVERTHGPFVGPSAG